MKTAFGKATGIALVAAASVGPVLAQTGWFRCIDPANTAPRSNYGINLIQTRLFGCSVGVSGTTTYGGQNGPCYAPTALTANHPGRYGFFYGSEGSGQTDFDDNLILTMGMPLEPMGSFGYATTLLDGARTLFGASAISLAFVGESDHYMVHESTNGTTHIRMQVDIIGDAARIEWLLTNTDTAAPHNIGLWTGHWIAMLSNEADSTGHIQSGSILPSFLPAGSAKESYTVVPGIKPPFTDIRFQRNVNPATFPQWVNFNFAQTTAYGMRIENGSTEATLDLFGQSETEEAAELVLGKHFFLMGADGTDSTFPDLILPDTRFTNSTAYIQKYPEAAVVAGGSRTIVQYVRSTWGASNYARPYSVVVDGPKLLATDPTGLNGLAPNEFLVRVWVDNTRGFSRTGQREEVPLNDVKVRLVLPAGLQLAAGQLVQQTIPVVLPREAEFVDFLVEADGETFGLLEYSAIVEPIPGPNKTIRNFVNVAATPRLNLVDGANLVTSPWQFLDSSWATILGLVTPDDFQAFNWDPIQNGYILSASASRARGTWIVANSNFGSIPLSGNPTTPPDAPTGAPLTQIKSGWNLIGNPYNYAFPLGQIVGVAAANPQQAFTWDSLVAQGFVSGSLAYWDTTTQSYKFIQGSEARLEPNTGFWIFVFTVQDVTVSWPPIFAEFLPGSSRSGGPAWTQTDRQWRLQLVARNNQSLDDQNYVGIAKSAADARSLRILEPPMGPTQKVGVSIEGIAEGRPTRLAQNLSDRAGRQEWKVYVDVKETGPVTITWPNVSTTPRNLKFRIEDVATRTSRDMRQASGYTFTMNEPGIREFKVQVDTGAVSRAVIGNVVAARPGRDGNAPFTINYTLSSDATTSVRILSGSGKEIFTVTRGRADRAGENSVTWALRDNANVAVAPGVYRVEILAETEGGERVRKIIPLNVIR